MDPLIYLIRHCQSGSPPGPESELTATGHLQAVDLADRLAGLGIRRIVSSPYRRAIQSVTPLADRLGVTVETDERLAERRIPFDPGLDWAERIRPTFFDLDLVLPDAESSRVAMKRAAAAYSAILAGGIFPVAVATHGQLLTLLLMHLGRQRGFDDWIALTSPDVFEVTVQPSGCRIERFWS